MSRRVFLGASALGSVALTGLARGAADAAALDADLPGPIARRPLVVQPVLVYGLPQRRPQTSWRGWGGIETDQDLKDEVARIGGEIDSLSKQADFPVQFLPLAQVHSAKAIGTLPDAAKSDVVLIYGASGDINGIESLGKPSIVFLRHRSGPVSLWYEIISPRYIRQHKDTAQIKGFDDGDVVVDRLDEVLWRLRALGGLVNTVGQKIVCIGGPDAWAQPPGVVPDLVKKMWKLDYVNVPYDQLAELIKRIRADAKQVERSRARAEAYLALPGTAMQTQSSFLENAFLLDVVFRNLMKEAGTRYITVNQCMGTIMPMSETSACMTLSTLNDDGYYAFCESDFVVIPSGMLMGNITGKPVFLNDPTYPHDGLITLAHCTAPRKLNGTDMEPVEIRTHFESDYGAAPKVEMKVGQVVTNIIPDFESKRWVGFKGEIESNPDLPICRSQIDVKFACDSKLMAERMPGFHWMTLYGDYLREAGYALKKLPIQLEVLT
jgi:hypothetical protein